ncbi:serine/threonine-protein kinase DCLK3 [Brienomyrus brachyistius]|uniref:serine/threonine-protein kinase DCLK3 n=1 Tax=Brienomyrus brachyistius TaxID=42636 RepID=UPI0020B1D321|nr:serine/threonine-protein kinase DCLK3 [Brienomyrus brachyistius]
MRTASEQGGSAIQWASGRGKVMMPPWKSVRSGQASCPKWKQPGQHTAFPKSIVSQDQWHGECWARVSRAPLPPCRSQHLRSCRLDEPYRPSASRFAFLSTHAEDSPMRPKIVTVVRPGGGAPLRKITILLNRRAVQTFEQLVADISVAMGLPRWKNDRVRRLFGLWGGEIRSVSDFFRNDDIFVAAARDRPPVAEVQAVLEELFPGDACFHGAVLRAWEKLLWAPAKASKADSGFHEEPETDRGLQARELRNSTHRPRDRAERDGQNARDRTRKRDRARREGQKDELPRVRRSNKAERPGGRVEEAHGSCCRECGRAGVQGAPLAPGGRRGIRAIVETGTSGEGRKSSCDGIGEWPQAGRVGGEDDQQRPKELEASALRPTQTSDERRKEKSRETGEGMKSPATRLHSADGQGEGLPGNPTKECQQEEESCKQAAVRPGGDLTHPLQSVKGGPATNKVMAGDKAETGPEASLPNHLASGADHSQADIECHYEMGRVIGDGNFATVRECWVRAEGVEASPFAMKIIDRAKLRGKEHMLQNEVSIASGLSHPNVVRLLRHYETAEHVFLLMELVHGGDLFDAITECGRFSEPSSAQMLRDLCGALDYIHARSIVHRDLKPENLLVQRNADGSTTLNLADFSLAMVVTEPIFTVCGTPTYVAPEILAEKGYGLPVDMWATGVITYVLLCGFPPFRSRGKDQDELFQLIQQGLYEFLPPYWDSISPDAKDFTGELLLVDVQRRLTARAALQHPWLQSKGQLCRQGHKSAGD